MPVVCLLVNHSFSTFDIHAYNDSPGPHENITHNMKLSLSNKLEVPDFFNLLFQKLPSDRILQGNHTSLLFFESYNSQCIIFANL